MGRIARRNLLGRGDSSSEPSNLAGADLRNQRRVPVCFHEHQWFELHGLCLYELLSLDTDWNTHPDNARDVPVPRSVGDELSQPLLPASLSLTQCLCFPPVQAQPHEREPTPQEGAWLSLSPAAEAKTDSRLESFAEPQ
jgi:hypothetical protein